MRSILFHNVVDHPTDPFDRACERLPTARFREHLLALAAEYDVVSFDRAMAMSGGAARRPPMLLTFDDGFEGVGRVALPMLTELGCVATVFVLTQDGSSLPPDALLHFERLELAFRLTAAAAFETGVDALGTVSLATIPDRVRALKATKRVLKRLPQAHRVAATEELLARLGVSEAAIQAFARAWPSRFAKLATGDIERLIDSGWTVGGHTRSHPSLATLDAPALEEEISGNARDLERAFGLHDPPFAYPYGGDEHVSEAAEAAIRRAGFCCAFTTMRGDNDAGTNRFRLHRYSLPDLQREGLNGIGTALA